MVSSKLLPGLVVAAALAGSLSLGGCADAPPVPQKEIRGHADQFNEKMKQEEAERGQGPGGGHGMMH